MIVEDSAWLLDGLEEGLRSVPFPLATSIAVSDGEAIEKLGDFKPQIVILDLKLKRGSGFTVLRRLVQEKDRPSVVVLTNYVLPKYRALALLLGADHFLDKALEMESVPRIIETIIVARGLARTDQ